MLTPSIFGENLFDEFFDDFFDFPVFDDREMKKAQKKTVWTPCSKHDENRCERTGRSL